MPGLAFLENIYKYLTRLIPACCRPHRFIAVCRGFRRWSLEPHETNHTLPPYLYKIYFNISIPFVVYFCPVIYHRSSHRPLLFMISVPNFVGISQLSRPVHLIVLNTMALITDDEEHNLWRSLLTPRRKSNNHSNPMPYITLCNMLVYLLWGILCKPNA